MEELVSLVREYCGAQICWSVVDRAHPWGGDGVTSGCLLISWLSGIHPQSALQAS